MVRPKKPPAERRSEPLGIRLTVAERAQLELSASTLGMTVAEFIRRRALNYRMPQGRPDRQVTAVLATALIRLGVNLNQIARHMNAGRAAPEYLPNLIARIDRALERLYDPRDHE